MRHAVLAAVLAVLAPAVAAAQPALTAPGFTPISTPPEQAPELKSESTATALAIGATVAGAAATLAAASGHDETLALTGLGLLVVGPSAGHLYAGEYGHAATLSLVRTGGLVLFGIGVLQATSVADCIGPCSDSGRPGKGLMLLGAGTFAIATAYDLFDAHRAAHRANARAAQSWSVAPTVLGSAGSRAPGVVIAGAF